jgi:hypothetical protein
MRVRPVRTVVVLAAVATSLAGCSSESSNAKPLAPLSATPTPTASVNKTATPSLSATGPTAASAAAFVRAYYAAVNKSAITGNANGLEKYSSKRCSTCRDYVASTKHYEIRHQRLDGPPFTLLSARGDPVEGTITTVALSLSSPAQNVIDVRGQRVERLPSRNRYSASAAVKWSRTGWLITDIVEFP